MQEGGAAHGLPAAAPRAPRAAAPGSSLGFSGRCAPPCPHGSACSCRAAAVGGTCAGYPAADDHAPPGSSMAGAPARGVRSAHAQAHGSRQRRAHRYVQRLRAWCPHTCTQHAHAARRHETHRMAVHAQRRLGAPEQAARHPQAPPPPAGQLRPVRLRTGSTPAATGPSQGPQPAQQRARKRRDAVRELPRAGARARAADRWWGGHHSRPTCVRLGWRVAPPSLLLPTTRALKARRCLCTAGQLAAG